MNNTETNNGGVGEKNTEKTVSTVGNGNAMNNTQTSVASETQALKAVEQHRYMEHVRRSRIIQGIAHWIVLVLSLALIVFISYDTFNDIPFLQNKVYMTFQFWVCVVFMADFIIELSVSLDKKRYVATHILFFLISIPYLNLLQMTGWLTDVTTQQLYFLRFIPLVRGAYALAMVVGALSQNKATNLLTSYAAILFSIIYFLSLIFYEQELPINSDVTDYWDALWWALMNVTTIGCDINPMSVAGQVCAVVLAASGMMMLPLFTVFVTSLVKDHYTRQKQRETEIREAFESSMMRHDEKKLDRQNK